MAEDPARRLTKSDAFLRQTSWDGTWNRIRLLIEDALCDSGAEPRDAAGGAAAI
jgi:hypothetical protein